MHFSKNQVVFSSGSPKDLAFGSHCLVNFQPILDCFIPNFKLKYEDLENIKADCASTIVFNLHQIKRQAFFWDTWYVVCTMQRGLDSMYLVTRNNFFGMSQEEGSARKCSFVPFTHNS